jgi:hypothetical protein
MGVIDSATGSCIRAGSCIGGGSATAGIARRAATVKVVNA